LPIGGRLLALAEKAGKATVVRSARKSADEVEMAISKIDALRKRQIGRAFLIRKFSYSNVVELVPESPLIT